MSETKEQARERRIEKVREDTAFVRADVDAVVDLMEAEATHQQERHAGLVKAVAEYLCWGTIEAREDMERTLANLETKP